MSQQRFTITGLLGWIAVLAVLIGLMVLKQRDDDTAGLIALVIFACFALGVLWLIVIWILELVYPHRLVRRFGTALRAYLRKKYAVAPSFRAATADDWRRAGDEKWVTQVSRVICSQGFTPMADLVEVSGAASSSGVRSAMRLLVSADATIAAHLESIRLSLRVYFVHWLRGQGRLRYLSFISHLAEDDGRYIVTVNSAEFDHRTLPPSIQMHRYGSRATVEDLLGHHHRHVREALAANPSASLSRWGDTAIALAHFGQIWSRQQQFFAAMNYLDIDQLAGLMNRNLTDAERAALEAMRGSPPSR